MQRIYYQSPRPPAQPRPVPAAGSTVLVALYGLPGRRDTPKFRQFGGRFGRVLSATARGVVLVAFPDGTSETFAPSELQAIAGGAAGPGR